MKTTTRRKVMEKYSALQALMEEMGSALVAFSGGVDSALVAYAAARSGIRCLAVTAVSPTLPEREREHAKSTAKHMGIDHVELDVDELTSDAFVANPPDRCYHCKLLRMEALLGFASENGFDAVVDGANADDSEDWRPGLKATSRLGVRSPLIESGIGKDEVRSILKEHGLPFWNKPSSPCLASRLPYGTRVTLERLRQIETAEDLLLGIGVTDVRVRHHGIVARIEVPPFDFTKVLSSREVIEEIEKLGFDHVSLDLNGFRSGSLNKSIADRNMKQETGNKT